MGIADRTVVQSSAGAPRPCHAPLVWSPAAQKAKSQRAQYYKQFLEGKPVELWKVWKQMCKVNSALREDASPEAVGKAILGVAVSGFGVARADRSARLACLPACFPLWSCLVSAI